MSVLPDTWLACKLGDVINYGTTQKAEPAEIPDDAWVLELEDIEKDTSKVLQRMTFKQRQSKSTKSRFETGDILYGKLRPYLNKVIRADQDGYCTTEIIPIKPTEIVEGTYLFHWLKTPTFIDYVTSVSHGLSMPRLGTEAGKQAPFVLAPIPEQKRIADKLDAVLARVDGCRDRLDRIPAILKRFRQSVLAAATTGKLTADWRGSDNEWAYSKTEDLCEWITKGTTPPKSGMCEGYGDVPYVKVYNLCFDGRLDFTINPTFVDKDTHEVMLKRSKVFPGDVLMNIVGPPLGKVSIVPNSFPEWNINQAIAVFRVKGEIYNRFLAYFLMNENTIAGLIRKSKATAGQFNLTLEICRQIEVPLPSMEEQTEIVRRVETLFACADRLEARHTAARAQVEKLTTATLAKAFRGELVPQDPNDEPASMLLERIHAQRNNKPKARK